MNTEEELEAISKRLEKEAAAEQLDLRPDSATELVSCTAPTLGHDAVHEAVRSCDARKHCTGAAVTSHASWAYARCTSLPVTFSNRCL